jgi:acetoin utilization protein AcuB
MTVQFLTSRNTPPLRPEDTVEHALGILMEMRVRHLPVVDESGMLVGMISEDQLLDAFDPEVEIQRLIAGRPLSARPDHHVFDVTKVMVEHDLTTLPLSQSDGRYVGLVKRHDIFDQFARMLSTHESGAILALEIEPRDYSLSRLVYTIEQNDVRVLSIASEPADVPDGTIRVTLKLNVTDSARVRHMLEHYGYHVVAAFGESEDEEDLLHRVQAFMRYLEV